MKFSGISNSLDNIGVFFTATSGSTSLSASTGGNITSLTLPAGKYVISGYAYLPAGSSNNASIIRFTHDSNCMQGVSQNGTMLMPMNITSIWSFTSDTTVYLQGDVLVAESLYNARISAIRVK